MTKERRLPTAGAPNFRDLGGYPAAGGKTVAWGKVFRSDDLQGLTRPDLDLMNTLGIRTVVDFRDQQEVSRHPDRLPASAANSVNIPIEAGKLMLGVADGNLTARKTAGIMLSVYRALAHDFQPAFREFFALLACPENLPLLFHCTAGKDRTGFAAALFLSALGVDRETVLDDYMLSNECLKNKYVAGIDYDDVMQPLFAVSRDYLAAAFAVIDDQYDGMDTYLRERLGVDIEYMRRNFTE